MSQEISKKIVSMQFQNEDFEKNVAQSLSTLEKLQATLNQTSSDSLEELSKVSKNVDLSKLSDNVDFLSKRFSFFGERIAEAKKRLWDFATGNIKKAWNWTIGGIIEGGLNRAMNIENAKFSLEALLGEENPQQVADVMADVSESVSGTRYALDEAAKAAATLTATGREASAQGGQLLHDLRAIVGVASMTNSEFGDIADIFTTIAGRNKMLGTDFNRLASRGLNAAETMADYFQGVFDGTIEATAEVKSKIDELAEDEGISATRKFTGSMVRQFVTDKKQLGFDLFSGAMENAFADAAFKANTTFEGSIANLRSALARIGEGFYAPLVAKNSKIVELFNALRLKVNELKGTLVFDTALGNDMALTKQLSDAVLSLADSVKTFVESIDIESAMRTFYYSLEGLKNVFKGIWSVISPIGAAIGDVFSSLGNGEGVLYNISKSFENFTSRLILSEQEQELLYIATKGLFDLIGAGVNIIIKFIDSFKGLSRNSERSTKVLKFGFLGVAASIGEVLSTFSKMINESSILNNTIKFLGNTCRKAVDYFLKIRNAFSSLIISIKESSVFNTAYNYAYKFFNYIKEITIPILNKIKNNINYLINNFSNLGESIKNGFLYLASSPITAIKSFSQMILQSNLLNNTFTKFSKTFPTISNFFSKIANSFNNFIEKIKESSAFNTAYNYISKFFNFIKDSITPIIEKIQAAIKNLVSIFKGFGKNADVRELPEGVSLSYARFGISLEGLYNIFEKIVGLSKRVVDFFAKVGTSFGGFITKIKESVIFNTVYNYAYKFFNYIKSIAIPIIDKIKEIIGGVITRFKELNQTTTRSALSDGGGFWEKSKEMLDKIKAFLTAIKDVGFEYISKGLKTVSDNLKDFVGKDSFLGKAIDKIEEVGGHILSLDFVHLSKWTEAIKDFFKNMNIDSQTSSNITEVNTMLDQYGNLSYNYDDYMQYNAAAYQGYSNNLNQSTIDLKNFLSNALNYYNKFKEFLKKNILPFVNSSTVGGVLGVGFALGLIKGLTNLSKFLNKTTDKITDGLESIKKAVDVFGKIFGKRTKEVTGAIKDFVDNLGLIPKAISKEYNSKAFVNYAAGIGIVALALGILAKFVDPERLMKVAIVMGGVMVIFTKAFQVLSTTVDAKTMTSVMLTFLGMAFALLIVVRSMDELFKMNFQEIEQLFEKITLIGVIFGALYYIVRSIRPTQGNIATFGTFIGIVVLLRELIRSLNSVVGLKIPTDIDKKLGIFGGAVVALGILCGVILHFAGSSQGAGAVLSTFIGAAILLWELTNALQKVMKMTIPENWLKRLGFFASLIVSLGLVILAIGFAGSLLGAGVLSGFGFSLIGAAILLWELTNALQKVMKMTIPENWLKRLGFFAALIAGLIIIIIAIGYAGRLAQGAVGLGGAILATCLLVVAIAGALALLQLFNFKKLLGAATSLGEVLIAVGFMLKLASALSSPVWKELLITCVLIVTIAGALSLLQFFNWKELLVAATALSEVIVAIGVALYAAGKVVSAGFWTNLVTLVEIVGMIGGVVYGLYWIDQQFGGDWERLRQVAESIGIVFGALGGSLFAISIAGKAGPAAVATGVVGFVVLLAGIAAIITGIGYIYNQFEWAQKAVDGLVGLAGKIGEMCGAWVDSFMVKSTENLESVGNNLTKFMNAATPFFDKLSDLGGSLDVIKGVKELLEVARGITQFGTVDAIDMDAFRTSLTSLGDGLNDFVSKVKNLDSSQVEGALGVIERLSDTTDKISPNTLTLGGLLFGSVDLQKWGKDISVLAEGLLIFGGYAEYITEAAVSGSENAMNVLKNIAEGSEKLPTTGGVKGFFAGNIDYSSLAKQLEDLAPSLVSYSKSIAGLDVNAAEKSNDAMKLLLDLTETLGRNTWSVNTNVSNFGKQLSSFADSFNDYYGKIQILDPSVIISVTDAIGYIMTLADLDFSVLSHISYELETFSQEAVFKYIATFNDNEVNAADAIKSFINKSLEIFKDENYINKFITPGFDIAKKILEGFTSTQVLDGQIPSAANVFINKLINYLNSKVNSFENAGLNSANGYIRGLNSQSRSVNDVSSGLAKSSLDAMRKTLDEHSPSGETEKIGSFSGQGFFNGILSWGGKIQDAGETLANTLIGGMQNQVKENEDQMKSISSDLSNQITSGITTEFQNSQDQAGLAGGKFIDEINKKLQSEMTTIQDSINTNFEFSPVVTPVVDMSNIDGPVSEMQSMFNGSVYSASVRANNSINPFTNFTNTFDKIFDDTNIINRLNDINVTVSELSTKINNLQVVLDSGTLVGQITPALNVSLGRMVNRQSRL